MLYERAARAAFLYSMECYVAQLHTPLAHFIAANAEDFGINKDE
jgi:hypothetical protein